MKVRDQMGRELEIKTPVRRIVSLVPSQTEFLYHLGLDAEVVGITKFCVHPEEWFRNKTRVGGTKNARVSRVKELCPDLIIGNKEENDQANIDDLKQIAPVWMSDIKTLDDAFEMMVELGKIVRKEEQAKIMVKQIQVKFDRLVLQPKKSALYFIWKDPWMLAGADTFISDMLEKCGFINRASGSRYPLLGEVNDEIDIILLSSEPYPFKPADMDEIQKKFPKAKVLFVDGEIFSWYGSRLLKATDYFQQLLTSIG
ncbi:helical backbone metal receptor [Crocinitomicaceae bacterium]|jgi:ABC-type Fe3+-hydroxamate transport system substrate-binding protein|nr:helical backbone metal receptor [Crocinitomicaceae bacterium]